MTAGVTVVRGEIGESFHRIHVAVRSLDTPLATDPAEAGPEGLVDAGGAGDPGRVVYLRSCAKPLQALPLVEEGVADALEMSDEELAVCCASHSGEARHLEVVGRLLSRIGFGPEALECGVRPPLRSEAAEEVLRGGEAFGTLHNNCSGKHTGMLALARQEGWPAHGYSEADHPVQRRMISEVARWSGIPGEEMGTGIDGCGVVTFALPLSTIAGIFARFAGASAERPGPARIVRAMTGHPFLVGGTGRLDTDLMELAGDRLFVKSGAGGMICAGVPGRGMGIALKVEDGSDRAAVPAFLTVVHALGLLDDGEADALRTRSRTVITDTRDRPVGRLVVEGLEEMGG